ncbi:MAG: PTS sugar transporter subunit IIA [Gammaproteobacteria bacterium]|nr:PTS sugar transporter subunit IIA [Gammaproteobacteria bacterium]
MSDEPNFSEIVIPERVRVLDKVNSRAAVLRTAGKLLADSPQELNSHEVIGALLKREQEGSTALDSSGVAVPHCRLNGCTTPIGCLFRMSHPVKFAGESVDLVFALVTSNESQREHLKILQACAKMFLNEHNLEELRQSEDDLSLHSSFQKLMNQTLAK